MKSKRITWKLYIIKKYPVYSIRIVAGFILIIAIIITAVKITKRNKKTNNNKVTNKINLNY